MSFVSPDALDSKRLLKYMKEYGIAIIVIFIVSCLILEFLLNWRPALNAKHRISYFLNRDPFSEGPISFELFWWIIYGAPFVITIIVGIMISVNLKPKIIGVDILIETLFSFVLLYAIMNYNRSGYNMTIFLKITIILCFLALFSLTIVHAVIVPRRSWYTICCYITWPALFVYYFIITIIRKRFNPNLITSILQSKENKENFVNDIVNDEAENLIKNNSLQKYLFYPLAIISGVAISIISNVFFLVHFQKNDKYATISTNVLFMIFDIFIIIIQSVSITKQSYVHLAILFILMKFMTIALAHRCWIVNQCLVFIIIGLYFLTNLFYIIIKKIFYNFPSLEKEDLIPENVRFEINKISQNETGMNLINIIFGVILTLILMIAIIVEIVIFKDEATSVLFSDGTYSINQRYFAIIILILVFLFAFTFAITKIDHIYGDIVHISSIYPILILFISFINFIIFYFVLKQKIYDIQFYIPIVYALISATILFTRTYKFEYIKNIFLKPCEIFGDNWIYTIAALIYLAFLILLIALPFTGTTKVHSLFVCSCIALLFCIYCLNIQSYSEDFNRMRIILGVFAVIFIITSVIGSFAIWKNNKYNVCAVDAIVIFVLGLSVVFFQIIRSHYRVDLEALIVTIFSCAVLYAFAFYLESTDGYSLLNFIYSPCGILLCIFVVYKYFNGGKIAIIVQSVISVVLFAAITAYHFVRRGSAVSYVTGIFISLYICCVLYCVISLHSSKKGRKIAISNFFFPVFHYENRHLKSIPMLGICFGYMFWVPLIFGTVLITYFTEPYWGFVLECLAFIVPFFITYGFLITIDNESIDSLSYVKSKNSIDSTIAYAMQAAETDYHHNSDSLKFYNYQEFIRFIENDENANRQKSLFYSAFRTQIIIISDIITIKNMRQISSYVESLGSKWKFMDDAVKKRILPPLEMRKQIATTVEIIENLTETDETQIRQMISDIVKRGEKINSYVLKYLRQFTPTTVNSYYANAYKNLTTENNKMRFVDPYFAPGGEPAQIDTDILAKVKFYRAEDLYTGEFNKGTKEDFKSGNGMINDDSIASVLIAIQNKPNLDLDRFFITPLLREKGLYMIKFNYKGVKAPVIVDSSVPYVERDSLLLEPSKRATSTFWFSLIEKAIAKMFGSYAQLDNCGLPSDIIPLFETGVLRCYYMQTDEIREIAETGILFNQIYNAINNGGIACATRVTADGISNYAITNCIYESDSTESLVLKGMKKYKDKTEFKIPLDTFLSDFRFVYTINDYPTWYLYELKFSFSAQEEKEVDPYDESKDSLLEVPNISVRCIKNDNHLLIGCQHQFPASPVNAYLVYNYGRPIDRIYVGRDYRSYEFKAEDYCAGTTPFVEWDINKKKMPWTLALVRKSLMVDSHCLFRIWSQNPLEFSLLETGTTYNTTVEIQKHEPNQ